MNRNLSDGRRDTISLAIRSWAAHQAPRDVTATISQKPDQVIVTLTHPRRERTVMVEFNADNGHNDVVEVLVETARVWRTWDDRTDLGTLAELLSLTHHYALTSVTEDDPSGSFFGCEWPPSRPETVEALPQVGGVAYWLDRESEGEDDQTPFVVATLDPTGEAIRFEEATAEDAARFPHAEDFNWQGHPEFVEAT